MRLISFDTSTGTQMSYEIGSSDLNSKGSSNSSMNTLPSALRTIGKRHLYGTRRRDRHFLSALLLTPSERAVSSTIDQSMQSFRDDLSPGQGTNQPLPTMLLRSQNVPMDRERMRNHLIALRETHRPPLSQADVAHELGIERETYKKWEQRGRFPSAAVLSLARALCCSADYLLDAEGERHAETASKARPGRSGKRVRERPSKLDPRRRQPSKSSST